MKFEILKVNIPNKNQRIYSNQVLKNAIDKYTKDFVVEQRAFLCKEVPESNIVNLTDVIGLVKSVNIESGSVVVEIEKLKDVNESEKFWPLLEQGKLHVRTVGMGTITKQSNGNYVVGDDYELISFMITDDPA